MLDVRQMRSSEHEWVRDRQYTAFQQLVRGAVSSVVPNRCASDRLH